MLGLGLGVGSGAGLGASLLVIADFRCTIPGDRGPVTGSRYTTFKNSVLCVCVVTGQIVSVETLTVPIQNGVVDCEVTRWAECADTDIPCAFLLRVYYNREVNGRIYGSDKVHIGPLLL